MNPFYVGENAALETLVLSEGITGIGQYRFGNYYYSGNNEYRKGFSQLKTVILPSTLTKIDYNAFYRAPIEEITFSGELNLTNNALSDLKSLKRIHIEAGTLGAYALSGCSGLTSVTLGDGVTTIGDYAFTGCSGLTSIELGEGISSIGAYAFQNCSALESLTIPDSVTSAGGLMLNGCTGLKYLKVGSGLNSQIMKNAYTEGNSMNPFYVGENAALG